MVDYTRMNDFSYEPDWKVCRVQGINIPCTFFFDKN